jgi:hypothetical protein
MFTLSLFLVLDFSGDVRDGEHRSDVAKRQLSFSKRLNSLSPFLLCDLGNGCSVTVNILRTWQIDAH